MSDLPGSDALLGKALRTVRTWQGLSRKELAKETNVSYAYLSQIEAGRKIPSARMLEKLGGGLGLHWADAPDEAESLFETSNSVLTDTLAAGWAQRAFGEPAKDPKWRSYALRLFAALPLLTVRDMARLVDLAQRLAGPDDAEEGDVNDGQLQA